MDAINPQMEQRPARRRGRPVGRFELSRRQCLRHLIENEPYRGSNEDLGKTLNCSARQAQRYLTSLRDIGAINITVYRHSLGPGQWANWRSITVLIREI